MSDLHRLVQLAKLAESGQHEVRSLIEDRVEFWKSSAEGNGPICCFFTRQKKDVGAKDQTGYVSLSNYVMAKCDDEIVVIGCSRGCVPFSNRIQE